MMKKKMLILGIITLFIATTIISSNITFAKNNTFKTKISSSGDTRFTGTAFIKAVESDGVFSIGRKSFMFAQVEGYASYENVFIGFEVTIDDSDDYITYKPFLGKSFTYDHTTTTWDPYYVLSFGSLQDA
jgi:hypothetical protein